MIGCGADAKARLAPSLVVEGRRTTYRARGLHGRAPAYCSVQRFRWSFDGVADVNVAVSTGMTLGFLAICLVLVWWVFRRTGSPGKAECGTRGWRGFDAMLPGALRLPGLRNLPGYETASCSSGGCSAAR